MKINAVILRNRNSENIFGSGNIRIYISFFVIAAGLVSGSLIYLFTSETLGGSIWNIFVGFFTDFSSKSNPEIISGLILSELPYFIVMFVLGFSVIGYPLVLILSFIKSMGPTFLFAYLYSSFGLKGAEYVFLVHSIGKIVMLLGVMMMTQSCFTMSMTLKNQLTDNNKDCKNELKKYIIRSLVIFGIFLLSSLINFLTITSFSSLFSF